MSGKLETQCWICPYCFDDHSQNRDCKVSDLKEQLDKYRQTSLKPSQDSVLKIVEDWQFFWMNQTLTKEDTKNYRNRACGIDANMRHNLADRIMEILK